MKRLIGIFIIALFFIGCVSTGKLEFVDNNIVIYDCDIEGLPNACEKYKVFTTTSFSSHFYGPNYKIGSTIKNNLVQPEYIKSLPNNLKKKKTIFVFNQETNIVDFYRVQKALIEKYSFKVTIDSEKLNIYADYTNKYTYAINSYIYWKEKAEDASNPMVEKTRSVPYTAYRTVTKSRTVTKYRTRFTTYGTYQEPYTDYEYYTVTEPYTAYRSETYMAPNPNYNPTAAIEYQDNASNWEKHASKVDDELNGIKYYTVYYNN